MYLSNQVHARDETLHMAERHLYLVIYLYLVTYGTCEKSGRSVTYILYTMSRRWHVKACFTGAPRLILGHCCVGVVLPSSCMHKGHDVLQGHPTPDLGKYFWVSVYICIARGPCAVWGKCSSKENKSWNRGLISVDRNNKATLLLTIPRFIFKSSAKDLSHPIF